MVEPDVVEPGVLVPRPRIGRCVPLSRPRGVSGDTEGDGALDDLIDNPRRGGHGAPNRVRSEPARASFSNLNTSSVDVFLRAWTCRRPGGCGR
jgi:hypothetical protein